MNWQALVTATAVVGIVALGVAGKFGPAGVGDQITLGAIQILGGFIGGFTMASASPTRPSPPTSN